MGLKKLLTDPSSFKYTFNSKKNVTDSYTLYKGDGYAYGPREVPYTAAAPGDGVQGNGTNPNPYALSSLNPLKTRVTSILPSVEDAPTSPTIIDSLYRGQGLVKNATIEDTKRISNFLLTAEGAQFLAKEQALLITQNIREFGSNIKKWNFINPLSYVANTALAPTGVPGLRNTFTFGIKPTGNTRETAFGEPDYAISSRKFFGMQRLDPNVSNTKTDKVTTSPMYVAQQVNDDIKDTVPFYFTIINNDGSGDNTYIHFRAYVEGLSDDYSADWKSISYMGRGEDAYMYNGFKRNMSFGFKIPVMSSLEQSSVFSKLNFLASCMAPDYTSGGFMRGNLIKITIGDYIKDLPGILGGVSYKINEDAGWDIGKKEDMTESGTYIMPKLIEVSGLKFTPIHNFIPQKVSRKFIDDGDGVAVNAPFITFGRPTGSSPKPGGYKNPPKPQLPEDTILTGNNGSAFGPLEDDNTLGPLSNSFFPTR
mgnify:CR=1 FL=1|tara:strand:- start:215 stop:1654 length:1440 start_codon:yes stop_codon:yes gene_type:complete